MIGLTRLADYGVVVLACMAADPAGVHSAASLSRETGLPQPTVSKVLKLLRRAGLVSSKRGVAGGYGLGRAPADISLAQAVEALDGTFAMTACELGGACSLAPRCAVRPSWMGVSMAIRRILQGMTLQDMAGPAQGTRWAP